MIVIYIAFSFGLLLGAAFTFFLWLYFAVKSEEGQVIKSEPRNVNGFLYSTIEEEAPEEVAGCWVVCTEKGEKPEKKDLKLEIDGL